MVRTRRTRSWEWLAYICISVLVVVGSLYLGVLLPEARADEAVFFIFATLFLFGLFVQRTQPGHRGKAFWLTFSLFVLIHILVVYKFLLFQKVFSVRNWSIATIVEGALLEGASNKFNHQKQVIASD